MSKDLGRRENSRDDSWFKYYKQSIREIIVTLKDTTMDDSSAAPSSSVGRDPSGAMENRISRARLVGPESSISCSRAPQDAGRLSFGRRAGIPLRCRCPRPASVRCDSRMFAMECLRSRLTETGLKGGTVVELYEASGRALGSATVVSMTNDRIVLKLANVGDGEYAVQVRKPNGAVSNAAKLVLKRPALKPRPPRSPAPDPCSAKTTRRPSVVYLGEATRGACLTIISRETARAKQTRPTA